MFLGKDEVRRLTGRVRHRAQCRALDQLGIRYVRAATGEPLVREQDVTDRNAPVRRNIDWSKLNVA